MMVARPWRSSGTCLPDSCRQPYRLERADLFCDGAFGRQPLHRARAVKTVHPAAVGDDVLGVGGFGNRTAMANDDDLRVDKPRRIGDVLDAGHAIIEGLG